MSQLGHWTCRPCDLLTNPCSIMVRWTFINGPTTLRQHTFVDNNFGTHRTTTTTKLPTFGPHLWSSLWTHSRATLNPFIDTFHWLDTSISDMAFLSVWTNTVHGSFILFTVSINAIQHYFENYFIIPIQSCSVMILVENLTFCQSLCIVSHVKCWFVFCSYTPCSLFIVVHEYYIQNRYNYISKSWKKWMEGILPITMWEPLYNGCFVTVTNCVIPFYSCADTFNWLWQLVLKYTSSSFVSD